MEYNLVYLSPLFFCLFPCQLKTVILFLVFIAEFLKVKFIDSVKSYALPVSSKIMHKEIEDSN